MTILEQFWQRSQTKELFLWAHLALLALLPLALVLTMAGLAVGDPLFPGWLEMPVLGVPIIAYVAWQQANRPIYPFSLGFVHRSVHHLSSLQRQILSIVKRPATGWIAAVTGVFLYVVFRQLYQTAPLAEKIAPFPDSLRFLGIVWALVFFLFANVIAQVGMVALRILVLPTQEFKEEYNPDQIKQDFTVLGVSQPHLWQFDLESTKADDRVVETKEGDAPPSVTTTEVKTEARSEATPAEQTPTSTEREEGEASPSLSTTTAVKTDDRSVSNPAQQTSTLTEAQQVDTPPSVSITTEAKIEDRGTGAKEENVSPSVETTKDQPIETQEGNPSPSTTTATTEEVSLPDIPDLVFNTEASPTEE